MGLLVAGVLLWMAVHLPKAAAPDLRDAAVARFGANGWRSFVSLALVGALVLMILGYRSATPAMAYRPPDWGHGAGGVVAVIGMILFVASVPRTNIKRYVRHPQLLSVVLWAAGHLLAGGSWPGVVLFGGLGLWAILEIRAINRRDGAWQRPEPAPRKADVIVLAGGLALSVVAIAVHHWRGIPVIAG
mgnify:FL=1